jgi:methionine-rich copper-binding protein CopC
MVVLSDAERGYRVPPQIERRAAMKTALRIALALTAASAVGQTALAHAKLVGATPAAGGVAAAPLGAISLAFNEELAGKLSGAVITDKAGARAPASATLNPKSRKSLVLAPTPPLKAGVYKVAWRAVASDDGHSTTGTFSFTVK